MESQGLLFSKPSIADIRSFLWLPAFLMSLPRWAVYKMYQFLTQAIGKTKMSGHYSSVISVSLLSG